DITRKLMISAEHQQVRVRAAIEALMSTLIKPAGAQRNTQNPHIVGSEGIICTSESYLPAPMISPLAENYREQVEGIRDTLNRIRPDSVQTYRFEDLAAGVGKLQE